MNGIELLQMIKQGKLKKDTRISVFETLNAKPTFNDSVIGVSDKTKIGVFHTTIIYDGKDIKWKEGTFRIAYLSDDNYQFYIDNNLINKLEEPKEMCSTIAKENRKKINEMIDFINNKYGKDND